MYDYFRGRRPVYNYRRSKDVVVIKYLSETNVNDYRRKNGTGKSEDPKYHDTDDMNIYGMCTTTRCDAKFDDDRVPLPLLEHGRLLPLRLVNLYFHYDPRVPLLPLRTRTPSITHASKV